MRALVLALACLMSVAVSTANAQHRPLRRPAVAEQSVASGPVLNLKLAPIRLRPYPTDSYRPLNGGLYAQGSTDPLKATTVDLGPFSARLGGTDSHANLARYRLEGTDLFGGSLSGTLDTRGAKVFWRWPPDEDSQ